MDNNQKNRGGEDDMENKCPICRGKRMMCEHACHGHWGKHGLMWIVVKIAVILIVFWLGFKLGEVSSYLRSYEYGGLHGGYYDMMGRGGYGNYGPWMMSGWYGNAGQQSTTTQK